MKTWQAVAALCVAPAALYCFGTAESELLAGPSIPTVVLLRPAKSDEVTMEAMARVKGELKAAGFEVAVLPLRGSDARRDLENAGRDLHPIAAFAIFVYPSDDGTSVAEIWVSDRVRQKTIIQNALLHDTDRGRGSEILAVRAVELLRANLADFWGPDAPIPPPTASVAPSPPPPIPTSREGEEKPRVPFGSGVGFGMGVAAIENFGAIPVAWAPEATATYGWPNGLSLRANLVGLGTNVSHSTGKGTVGIEQQLVVLEAVKTWWPTWPVVPFVLAGTGALHVHVTGTGNSPYRGHTPDDWSVLTTLGVGAGVPMVSTVSLVAQARAYVAWPYNAVQIDNADVTRVGLFSLLMDAELLGVFP